MGYLPRKVTLPLRESSSSLVNTATRVFRERAATKQREFIGAAQTHVAKGAAMLSDAIEDKLEDVIDRVPGGSQVGHSSNRLCRRRSRQRSKLSCRGVRARLRVEPGPAELGILRGQRGPTCVRRTLVDFTNGLRLL
jgi:hypothetical protein